MYYEPFLKRFPEVAHREARSIIAHNHAHVPNGEYHLVELFCAKPGCDCRRVMFSIYRAGEKKSLATISYGWESAAFYAKWYGSDDPNVIREMQGPALNIGSPISPLSPILLKLVRGVLLDKAYVARVKRHYRMFKNAVDAEAGLKKQVGLRQRPLPKGKRQR